MGNIINGDMGKLMLPIASVLISLLIGGGVITQGQSQISGVSDRMVEVLTDIERLDGSHEDTIRRVANIEILEHADIAMLEGRLTKIETTQALMSREEAVLLEEVEKFYVIKDEFEDYVEALAYRIRELEYQLEVDMVHPADRPPR